MYENVLCLVLPKVYTSMEPLHQRFLCSHAHKIRYVLFRRSRILEKFTQASYRNTSWGRPRRRGRTVQYIVLYCQNDWSRTQMVARESSSAIPNVLNGAMGKHRIQGTTIFPRHIKQDMSRGLYGGLPQLEDITAEMKDKSSYVCINSFSSFFI